MEILKKNERIQQIQTSRFERVELYRLSRSMHIFIHQSTRTTGNVAEFWKNVFSLEGAVSKSHILGDLTVSGGPISAV